jgi:hypothetical protein
MALSDGARNLFRFRKRVEAGELKKFRRVQIFSDAEESSHQADNFFPSAFWSGNIFAAEDGSPCLALAPTKCGLAPTPVAGGANFWSAAGSEAPRRFGFGAGAALEPGLGSATRRKCKAPSPLRSAGALQNLTAVQRVGCKPNARRGSCGWKIAGGPAGRKKRSGLTGALFRP